MLTVQDKTYGDRRHTGNGDELHSYDAYGALLDPLCLSGEIWHDDGHDRAAHRLQLLRPPT
ncbi:hypothetical protein ACFSUI_20620 [Ralstonia solanacearum]